MTNKLNGLKSDINEERAQELFSCILDSYELVTFDLDRAKKIKIGEKDKIKRVCRFCKKSAPDVSFKRERLMLSQKRLETKSLY
ncbi:MAG: hypothetical protein MZV65_17000 [Chromatiales bacterium]|nr:hypothetical protein [Chromatiales bacterium]